MSTAGSTAILIELDTPYSLSESQTQQFHEDGFIKLKNVFTQELLDLYGKRISELTFEHDLNKGVAMEDRNTYAKAFIQVHNLWTKDAQAKTFAFSKRLAGIATQLLGTAGVRMWHDQALYKEPSGGFTPWHADQQYWPMGSGLCVTAWIALQAVPMEMGPLSFAKGSHRKNIARDIEISDESEVRIQQMVKEHGLIEINEPFELGEVSFHYGWTLHRAGPNTTERARKVHTIIYMDQDMKLAKPKNQNQQNDWDACTPSTKIGEVMADALNPVLYP